MRKHLISALIAMIVLVSGYLGYLIILDPGSSEQTSSSGSARSFFRGSGAPTSLNSTAPFVRTEPATPGSRQPRLQLFGETQFSGSRQIVSEFASRVTSLAVSAGDAVNAGDLLATLSTRDLERQLQQVENRIAEQEAVIRSERQRGVADEQNLQLETELLALNLQSLRRVEGLSSRNLASAADVESARRAVIQQEQSVASSQLAVDLQSDELARLTAQLAGLQSEREALIEDIELATIRAPATGIVDTVNALVGQPVGNGTALLTLHLTEPFQVRVGLPVRYLDLLKEGYSLPGFMSWHGESAALRLNSWDSELANGALTARFDLVSPGRPLLEGVIAEVELLLPAQDQVLSLPDSAVYNNTQLFTVVDGQLRRHSAVVLGRSDTDNHILVRAPSVNAGELVMTTRLERPDTGLRVRILESDT